MDFPVSVNGRLLMTWREKSAIQYLVPLGSLADIAWKTLP